MMEKQVSNTYFSEKIYFIGQVSTTSRGHEVYLLLGTGGLLHYLSSVHHIDALGQFVYLLAAGILQYSETGHVIADSTSKFTFEAGGRNKKRKQIANILDAYRVEDDIEYGSTGVIPPWAFGLMR